MSDEPKHNTHSKMATQKANPLRTERKPALGISWDVGDNGAVVVYIGREEIVLALLPSCVALDSRSCTCLAVAYKSQKVKKPLSVKATQIILDRIRKESDKPVIVNSQAFSRVLALIHDSKAKALI